MPKLKRGKIDTSALLNAPEPHELATAEYFARRGKDVTFIQHGMRENVRYADFWMDGVLWEAKSPKGSGKDTIKNIFKRAVGQSRFIVIDLRRTKLPDNRCVGRLEREFQYRKYLKRVLIITKTRGLIDLSH